MPKKGEIKQRFVLPLSIRCDNCRNYIGRGARSVARMEYVAGETYLGVRPIRFLFNCPHCSADLTIKTDPQNSDYVVETGAERVHQPRPPLKL